MHLQVETKYSTAWEKFLKTKLSLVTEKLSLIIDLDLIRQVEHIK